MAVTIRVLYYFSYIITDIETLVYLCMYCRLFQYNIHLFVPAQNTVLRRSDAEFFTEPYDFCTHVNILIDSSLFL